jgi:hypothetical protein
MSEIQALELAEGIRDRLILDGYTLEIILKSSPSELSKALGVDQYVAKLIIEAAKRASGLVVDESHDKLDFVAAD